MTTGDMKMRALLTKFAALAALSLALVAPVAAQQPQVFYTEVTSLAGNGTAANGAGASSCAIIKYTGTTAGKPTVAVAAGGDMTLSVGAGVDTTTGWVTAFTGLGVFDLSTPDTTINTMGKLVNIVNTTGSNWKMVLTGCLASDNTDNTIDTLATTDAAVPGGVVLFKDAAVASASAVFSAQVALLPEDAGSNFRFWASGGPVGNTTGSTKIDANALAHYQTFVQNVREKITSTGVVALFEILGVKRTYDGLGKVSETVRSIWSVTGAATTVETAKDFNSGPIISAPGEIIVVRQRTATDLTALQINGNAYAIRNSNK